MITTEGKRLTRVIAEGTALFLGNTIIVKVGSFISVLLLARWLSVYSYGILRLAQSAISSAGAFFFTGATSVIIAEGSRYRGEGAWGKLRSLLTRYALVECAIGALLAVGFLLAARLAPESVPAFWRRIFVSAAPLVFLGALRMVATVVIQIYLRLRWITVLRTIESVGNCIVVVVVVFVLRTQEISTIFFAYGIVQCVAVGSLLPIVYTLVKPLFAVPAAHADVFAILFRQSIWALLGDYTKNLTENARLWIIAAVIGVEATALYSLADSLFGHTVSLFPLSQVLLPVVSGQTQDPERMRRIFVRSVKFSLFSNVILFVCGLLFVPPLVHLAFPKYIPALSIYTVMLFGLACTAFGPTLNVYLTIYREQRTLWLVSLVRSAAVIGGIWVFTQLFGLIGTGIEFLISLAVFTGLRYAALRARLPYIRVHLKEFLHLDAFDREILAALYTRLQMALRRAAS